MNESLSLQRVTHRLAHQRYAEQRFDRCSRDAIETLAVAHELLALPTWKIDDDDARHEAQERQSHLVADMLAVSQRVFPVTVEGVWPNGTPAHWAVTA